MEFLGQIGIEPKLVLAQIVNFLALVFILRVLLYKPLLAIFSKRREAAARLQEDLSHIEKKKQEADAAGKVKLLEAEGRAAEIVERARKAAGAFAERSLEENSRYADELFRDTKTRIEGMKQELARANSAAIAGQALHLTVRYLRATLGRELHEVLAKNALSDFADVAERGMTGMPSLPKGGAIEVRSAFPVLKSFEAQLRRVAVSKLGKNASLTLVHEPDLGAGMQIRCGGYLMDGSLRARLQELAEKPDAEISS